VYIQILFDRTRTNCVNLKVDVPEHDVVYTIDVGGSGTNGVMLCLSYSFIIATNNVLLPVAQLIGGGGGSPGSRDTPFNRICTEDFGTSCHRRPPQGDNLTLRDPLKKNPSCAPACQPWSLALTPSVRIAVNFFYHNTMSLYNKTIASVQL